MPNLNLGTLGLADFSQRLSKPRRIDIKWLAAFDARKLNRAQYEVIIVIVTDNARFAAERALNSKIGARLDQANVFNIGSGSAGEIT